MAVTPTTTRSFSIFSATRWISSVLLATDAQASAYSLCHVLKSDSDSWGGGRREEGEGGGGRRRGEGAVCAIQLSVKTQHLLRRYAPNYTVPSSPPYYYYYATTITTTSTSTHLFLGQHQGSQPILSEYFQMFIQFLAGSLLIGTRPGGGGGGVMKVLEEMERRWYFFKLLLLLLLEQQLLLLLPLPQPPPSHLSYLSKMILSAPFVKRAILPSGLLTITDILFLVEVKAITSSSCHVSFSPWIDTWT